MQGNQGGRPQKLKISLTPESLTDILSKAYSESQDLRQKSIQVFNRNSRNMTDNSDIAAIGKTNAEYLKIAANATDATLNIARIIKDYIQKDKVADENGGGDSLKINDSIKEDVYAMMNRMKQDNKKLPSGSNLTDKFNEIEEQGLKKVIEGKPIEIKK